MRKKNKNKVRNAILNGSIYDRVQNTELSNCLCCLTTNTLVGFLRREIRPRCRDLLHGDTQYSKRVHGTHLGLQITVNHVKAVQIGERERYLRRVELPLVVGESVRLDGQALKKHRHGVVADAKRLRPKHYF